MRAFRKENKAIMHFEKEMQNLQVIAKKFAYCVIRQMCTYAMPNALFPIDCSFITFFTCDGISYYPINTRVRATGPFSSRRLIHSMDGGSLVVRRFLPDSLILNAQW